MPTHVHDTELIGGPLDGFSWAVVVGQSSIDVPIDQLQSRGADEPVDCRLHRYALLADGRYRYAGVLVRVTRK
jgi:hypothetical protein